MYTELLVPISMKDIDAAVSALDTAAAFATAFGGAITIMHLRETDEDDARAIPDKAAMEFKEFVDEQSARLGLALGGAFRVGDRLSEAIREIVEEYGIDLVVMKTHDPSWLDYVVGSRSSTVALHTPCSVLLVR